MSEQESPQETGSQEETQAPAEPTPPVADSGGAVSSNRNLMIVLAYIYILFLVPLLAEKEDAEVQWHAKHGLVLTILEIGIQIVLNMIVATGIGCVFAIFIPLVFIAFAVVRVVAMVKGINGERFMIPGVSQYADRF